MANAERTKYKNQWQKEHVDRINLTVPKGQKEIIQAHTTAHGESVNRFINRAIEEAMERDHLFNERKDDVTEHASSHNVSIEDQERLKQLVTAFAALESVIPDIEHIYFSKLPQPGNCRAGKIYIEN